VDANLTLLIISALTAGAIVLQLLRIRPPELISHLVAPVSVLGIAGGAYLSVPQSAGFIAFVACGLLMLVPLYSAWPMSRALAAQRFERARVFAWLAVVLNPIAPRRRTLKTIALLEAIDQGRMSASELDPRSLGKHERGVYVQALRAEGRYDEIIEFCRSLPAAERARDLGLSAHEVRALGEVGRYDEMVELAKNIQERPGALQVNGDVRMMALALLGQVELSGHFAALRRRFLGEPIIELWRATALAAAGDPRAVERFEALASSTHDGLRRAARARLTHPVAVVDLSTLPSAQAYVDEVRAEVASAAGMDATGGRVIATRLIMAAITAMYCLQIPGGVTDTRNLVELGALIVPPVPGFDEPWRLVTAALLHLGFAHFAMNMLGLWILGRRIEGALGSVRLGVVFLGTAVLGNEAAVLLMAGPAVVVGASGGVLGLLGALVGIVLNRRRRGSTRYLDGVLREVAGIAITQVAFDLVMPNIGTTVHIGGFIAGIVLGFLLMPGEREAELKTSSR
jgi:rhomboid protease GluP